MHLPPPQLLWSQAQVAALGTWAQAELPPEGSVGFHSKERWKAGRVTLWHLGTGFNGDLCSAGDSMVLESFSNQNDSMRGQELGAKAPLGREAQGMERLRGSLLCLRKSACAQGAVSKSIKGCVPLSLGFEKEICKQMEKGGPGIFPVSASRFFPF